MWKNEKSYKKSVGVSQTREFRVFAVERWSASESKGEKKFPWLIRENELGDEKQSSSDRINEMVKSS